MAPEWRWPAFLVAIPATSVLVGIVMVVLATGSWDGLVRDDYYKAGLFPRTEAARDERAWALGVRARIDFETTSGIVARVETDDGTLPSPRYLELAVLHPTRAGEDFVLRLPRQPDGRFRADVPPPEVGAGPRTVELQDSEGVWRLRGQIAWPVAALRLRAVE